MSGFDYASRVGKLSLLPRRVLVYSMPNAHDMRGSYEERVISRDMKQGGIKRLFLMRETDICLLVGQFYI